jgi:RNA polymerase-binding transcription factor DksA
MKTKPRNFRTATCAAGTTPNSCGPEKIDPQWAWHYRTLVRLRERLLQASTSHAQQAAVTPDPEDAGADAAREEIDRDVLLAELHKESDQLFEVDSALERIREGVYGLCQETGQPISPERLRAIPWTRYAIVAAQALERRPVPPGK